MIFIHGVEYLRADRTDAPVLPVVVLEGIVHLDALRASSCLSVLLLMEMTLVKLWFYFMGLVQWPADGAVLVLSWINDALDVDFRWEAVWLYHSLDVNFLRHAQLESMVTFFVLAVNHLLLAQQLIPMERQLFLVPLHQLVLQSYTLDLLGDVALLLVEQAYSYLEILGNFW